MTDWTMHVVVFICTSLKSWSCTLQQAKSLCTCLVMPITSSRTIRRIAARSSMSGTTTLALEPHLKEVATITLIGMDLQPLVRTTATCPTTCSVPIAHLGICLTLSMIVVRIISITTWITVWAVLVLQLRARSSGTWNTLRTLVSKTVSVHPLVVV